jgi:hypothetical protein
LNCIVPSGDGDKAKPPAHSKALFLEMPFVGLGGGFCPPLLLKLSEAKGLLPFKRTIPTKSFNSAWG